MGHIMWLSGLIIGGCLSSFGVISLMVNLLETLSTDMFENWKGPEEEKRRQERKRKNEKAILSSFILSVVGGVILIVSYFNLF